ncbi:hypothetical protein ACLB2K_037750 [Fragaria x ananassa]
MTGSKSSTESYDLRRRLRRHLEELLEQLRRLWPFFGKWSESGRTFRKVAGRQGADMAEAMKLMVRCGIESMTWIFGGGAQGVF